MTDLDTLKKFRDIFYLLCNLIKENCVDNTDILAEIKKLEIGLKSNPEAIARIFIDKTHPYIAEIFTNKTDFFLTDDAINKFEIDSDFSHLFTQVKEIWEELSMNTRKKMIGCVKGLVDTSARVTENEEAITTISTYITKRRKNK